MKETEIPALNLKLQYQAIREQSAAALGQVLERQDFILGREVEELEQEVAWRQGCAYGIGCASGSDALLLSLLALGVGPGTGVLVPSFTFFATASSVARAGARPLFVDIDPRTFTISPAAVEETLRRTPAPFHEASHAPARSRSSNDWDRDPTNEPGRAASRGTGPADTIVKAIIPVHLYGQCADMDPLLALAKQHHLHVIEDAAQAILARYRGQSAGSLGLCGCFSFYPTKNLGGFGDGGMVTTNDADLAERLCLLRNHGSRDKRVHACLGMNSRLDTLQAAVLLVKLRHLEEWTKLRRQKAAFYREAFLNAGLCNPATVYPTGDAPVALPYQTPEAEHVFHQFTVRALRRDELATYLANHGIETAIYYPLPLHCQPAFAYLGTSAGACPESERAAGEVLSLPLYPELTDEQQLRVVRQIKNFYFS